jgi:hypothetical protein
MTPEQQRGKWETENAKGLLTEVRKRRPTMPEFPTDADLDNLREYNSLLREILIAYPPKPEVQK